MTNNDKTHETIVSDWRANAKGQDKENYLFLRSLKRRSYQKTDRIALELHQEAFGIVDCTKCANCCRTLRPVFSEEDIARIAGHFGMARDDFIATLPRPRRGRGPLSHEGDAMSVPRRRQQMHDLRSAACEVRGVPLH